MPTTILWNGYTIDVTDNDGLYLYWNSSTSTNLNAESLWTSFAAAYPAYASEGKFHRIYSAGGNDTLSRSTSGGCFSGGGNDTINDYATTGTGQIHSYAGAGNDTLNMYFTNIAGSYSHGHHNKGDDAAMTGSDSFNFLSTGSVGAGETVVGRIEDFDGSRDTIRIDGVVLNLNALPANVKIVMHNGDHNDAGAAPQQWLVIKTATGGYILYSLEGARIDMDGNGGANGGTQEGHFLSSNQVSANAIKALFGTQPSAAYFDAQNYVPAGAVAQGGLTINDSDGSAANVTAAIAGGTSGDLIAAGLNNDVVNAGAGNDQVWGGSGHDVVNGDAGNDSLSGNLGNDVVNGGDGNDIITYHSGADTIDGGLGTDTLIFSGATAVIISLQNVFNNQSLAVSNIENLTGTGFADELAGDAKNNTIIGNDGNDTLTGWAGNDTLQGGNGNDFLKGLSGVDVLDGGAGNDILEGGTLVDALTGGLGNDSFRFTVLADNGDTISDFGNVAGNDDLIAIKASAFGGGLAAGALASTKFWASTANTAHDADDRFIFRTTDKTLWFDADGNGTASAAVLVANLQDTAANLTYLDILLY